VAEPPLLLADEPTGNLDPANKQRVLDILLDFVEESDATLLTVTHDRDLLPRFTRTIDFKAFHSGTADPAGTADTGGTADTAGAPGAIGASEIATPERRVEASQ
jgi:energy-coupling factor transporter ATP-binding protein EcfA2